MLAKALEIRDKATFIPVLAVSLNSVSNEQYYLLRRCGYSSEGHILITRLSGESSASADYYFWGDRTWAVAHKYIIENWDDLSDGDVVDVEFILGETKEPKLSERFE